MFELITSIEQLPLVQEKLAQTEEISLDTEGTSLDPFTNQLLLLQFELDDTIFIVDCRIVPKKIITYFIDLFKESGKTIVGHNIKYDAKVLRYQTGIHLTNLYDTMVGEGVITKGLENIVYHSYSLLVEKYFGVVLDKDIRDKFVNFDGVITQEMLLYSSSDVKYLKGIKEKQIEKAKEQKQLQVLELESGLVSVVADMEYHGVYLDAVAWKSRMKKSEDEAKKLEEKIKEYLLEILDRSQFKNLLEVVDFLKIPAKTKKLRAELESINADVGDRWIKENFNCNSPYQIGILLKLDGVEVPDTNAKTLEKVASSKSVQLLQEYRNFQKEVSSFGNSFIEKINPITGRIHAEANQIGTISGRFSYTNPNLQQVKREDDYRRCFTVPNDEWQILSIDYSQAELRIMGALSREPLFIKAYKNGEDLHKLTASEIFGVPIEEVTKDQRQIAKNVNFSLIYGISEYGLYYRYGIPIETGRDYIKKYFNLYQNIKAFNSYCGEKILEKGYSVTLFGRKRYFVRKKIYTTNSERFKEEGAFVREGINHMIQGLCADVLKISMLEIGRENPFPSKLQLLFQVHDELVVMVHKSIAEKGVEYIKNIMLKNEQKYLGEIPAEVDYKLLPYWSK